MNSHPQPVDVNSRYQELARHIVLLIVKLITWPGWLAYLFDITLANTAVVSQPTLVPVCECIIGGIVLNQLNSSKSRSWEMCVGNRA